MRKADLIAAISEGGYPGGQLRVRIAVRNPVLLVMRAGNSAPSDAVARRLLRTPNSINLQGGRKLRR